MAERDDLEARIVEDPSDVEVWRVYADLLQKLGDLRGEWIALQMAAEAEHATNPKKIGKAQLAERKYREQHAATLVGPLDALGDQLAWRFGFVTTARFEKGSPGKLLDTVLSHPSGRFVSAIAIKRKRKGEPIHSVLEALERHQPRALKDLELSAYEIGDLERYLPYLADLHRISLTAGQLRLAELDLPHVRRASFAALTVPPATMRAIANAHWPHVERLEVRLGTHAPFAAFEDLVPLLRREDMPSLAVLKLRCAPHAGAILRELATRPLGAQLEVLDLSNGKLTPQDVQFVSERKQAFVKLRELWLPSSAFSGGLAAKLAGIAKHVVPDSKAPLDTLDQQFPSDMVIGAPDPFDDTDE